MEVFTAHSGDIDGKYDFEDDADDDLFEDSVDAAAAICGDGRRASATLPPPMYDSSVFLLSCRPVSAMSKFSRRLLLFQPDLRPFCANGLDCGLLRCSEHLQRYMHLDREEFHRQVALDSLLKTELVGERGTEIAKKAIPFVRTAYDINQGGISRSPLVTAYQHAAEQRPILVYVHGFKERFARHINTLNHLKHLLTSDQVQAPAAPFVLGFTWPCHKKPWSYARAREKTELAAPLLAEALADLRQISAARRSPLVIVAHSLGCRLVLRALSRCREPLVDTLILAGAAVSSGSLAEDGKYPASMLAAHHIVVAHARSDPTLSGWYSAGETWAKPLSLFKSGTEALGAVGPVEPVPRNVEVLDLDVDCAADGSTQFAKHGSSAYIQHARVSAAIRKACFCNPKEPL